MTVSLPTFEYDNTVNEGLDIIMKGSMDFYAPIKIGISALGMQYVRNAMLKSMIPDSKKRNRPSVNGKEKMYRWLENRSVFLASRCKKGVSMTKSFKVNNDDDESMVAAREQAEAWCMADSDEGSDSDDEHNKHESAPTMFSIVGGV